MGYGRSCGSLFINFMIVSLLYLAGSMLIGVITAFLQGVNFILPEQIQTSFLFLFRQLNYLRGVMPVQDFVLALSFLISIVFLKYLVKVFLFVYALLPFIGKSVKPPHS